MEEGPLSGSVEHNDIIHRGVVFKLARNGRLVPVWHRRFAVLNAGGQLYLYSDESMRSVRRVVDLHYLCLRIKFAEETSDDYCNRWPKRAAVNRRISLINMDRTYHFYMQSDEEAMAWKEAFTTTARGSARSNWMLEEPSKLFAQADRYGGSKPTGPPRHAVLDLRQEEEGGHVSETILVIGDVSDADDDKEAEHLQPLELPDKSQPSGSDHEQDQEADRSDDDEEEFGGYDEVGRSNEPPPPRTLKERLSMFERRQQDDLQSSGAESSASDDKCRGEEKPEEDTTTGMDRHSPSEETLVAGDPAPLRAAKQQPGGVDNTVPEPTEAPEEQLRETPPLSDSSPTHEGDAPRGSVLDYSSQVMRLSQRKDKLNRNRRSSYSSSGGGGVDKISNRSSSPSHDEPEPGLLEENPADPTLRNAVGPPVGMSTPLKLDPSPKIPASSSTDPAPLPTGPAYPLGSVPEDTALARSSPKSSFKDRMKAFSGGGGPPSPPSSQRHRRISEPVKPAQTSSDPPTQPSKDKRSMSKVVSASVVGEPLIRKDLPWETEASPDPHDRVQMAAKWVDKELRKLIQEIQRLGQKSTEGQWQVKFGLLFEETANIFEALSGTLKTAKKHKLVLYEGELLFQSYHDDVVITLIKEDIDELDMSRYTTSQPKGLKRDDLPAAVRSKTAGFSQGTAFTGNSKCAICTKRVYATEFVAANDKPLHKACFRCCQCSKQLTTSTFATIDDKFYCTTHYERLYMEKGNYSFS